MRICTLLFVVLSSIASAQGEPEMKSGDFKKIAKPTAAWIDARINNEASKVSEAIISLEEQIEKINKKLKGRQVLSYVYDWEVALHQLRKYATSGPSVKKGKVLEVDDPNAAYSVWLPSKYNPKKNNYQCIVLLGAQAADTIVELPSEVLDSSIVLAPDVSSMSADLVLTIEAAISVIVPIGKASQGYHLDRMRLFLVGTDELGSQMALQWGAVMPHMFAGIATTVEVASKIAGAGNLELVASDNFGSVADAVTWCSSQPRTHSYPLEYEFEIPFTQQSRVFWVHPIKFDSAENPFSDELAKIKVSVDRSTNTITIDATAVDRVKLYLNDVIVDLDKPVNIIRNGVPYSYQPARSVGTLLSVFASSFDGAAFPAVIREVDIPQPEEPTE